MANRIAISADTMATITSTSASIANRIADFMLRGSAPAPSAELYSAASRSTLAYAFSTTYEQSCWLAPRQRHPCCPSRNLTTYARSIFEVRHVFPDGVSYLCAATDPSFGRISEPARTGLR